MSTMLCCKHYFYQHFCFIWCTQKPASFTNGSGISSLGDKGESLSTKKVVLLTVSNPTSFKTEITSVLFQFKTEITSINLTLLYCTALLKKSE